NPQTFAGKRILIVGGGDSAFDWAVNLHGVARSIVMIHRRDGFRAHQATVDQVQALAAAGKMELRTFWELKAIGGSDRIERVTIINNKAQEAETLPMDCVIPQHGFVSSPGALAGWALVIQQADIKLAQTIETNNSGLHSAGP